MQIHGRTKALIGVLAIAFAVAMPTSAFAGHDLGIYKVEKHVDLDSDETIVDLSCQPGDIVLDGMWRIDHADQDDDDLFITSLARAVDVAEAYPLDLPGYDVEIGADLPTQRESYHFLFNKNAIGRAQVKVFATCIKDKTEVDGHQHKLVIDEFGPVNEPDGTFTSTPCDNNEFVSQPGFKINQVDPSEPDPFIGHVSTSWPTNIKTWDWVIDLDQDSPNAGTHDTSTVDFYWACMQRKVPLAGGEKHKLVYRLQGPEPHSIPANKVKTKRIECKSHYKAVVAGMSFDGTSTIGWDPNPDYAAFKLPKHWWLGMDPQPKNRDFKFLNSDAGGPMSVELKAICLNYRTT